MAGEVRQRQPRLVCPAFLAFVRRQRCCVCGAPAPSQAAHIRMACPERGKPPTGMAQKPDDRFATPLCQSCHLDGPNAQHRIGEAAFWFASGLDPFLISGKLWRAFVRSPDFVEPMVRRPVKMRPRQKRPGHAKIPMRSSFAANKSKAKIPSRPFPAGRKFRRP